MTTEMLKGDFSHRERYGIAAPAAIMKATSCLKVKLCDGKVFSQASRFMSAALHAIRFNAAERLTTAAVQRFAGND
ncbi:hypothetical protein T4E_2470 [Trichinella pseudospiralis]|uniref:Uncharacterized protein n=1 Tax=Trichinella pseudospiralis TaxID=6337 RepID=A0A0V0YB09_TRIPS|nr:hypothetical protein T4E_2470 [Trichinella pseudospiralis]